MELNLLRILSRPITIEAQDVIAVVTTLPASEWTVETEEANWRDNKRLMLLSDEWLTFLRQEELGGMSFVSRFLSTILRRIEVSASCVELRLEEAEIRHDGKAFAFGWRAEYICTGQCEDDSVGDEGGVQPSSSRCGPRSPSSKPSADVAASALASQVGADCLSTSGVNAVSGETASSSQCPERSSPFTVMGGDGSRGICLDGESSLLSSVGGEAEDVDMRVSSSPTANTDLSPTLTTSNLRTPASRHTTNATSANGEDWNRERERAVGAVPFGSAARRPQRLLRTGDSERTDHCAAPRDRSEPDAVSPSLWSQWRRKFLSTPREGCNGNSLRPTARRPSHETLHHFPGRNQSGEPTAGNASVGPGPAIWCDVPPRPSFLPPLDKSTNDVYPGSQGPFTDSGTMTTGTRRRDPPRAPPWLHSPKPGEVEHSVSPSDLAGGRSVRTSREADRTARGNNRSSPDGVYCKRVEFINAGIYLDQLTSQGPLAPWLPQPASYRRALLHERSIDGHGARSRLSPHRRVVSSGVVQCTAGDQSLPSAEPDSEEGASGFPGNRQSASEERGLRQRQSEDSATGTRTVTDSRPVFSARRSQGRSRFHSVLPSGISTSWHSSARSLAGKPSGRLAGFPRRAERVRRRWESQHAQCSSQATWPPQHLESLFSDDGGSSPLTPEQRPSGAPQESFDVGERTPFLPDHAAGDRANSASDVGGNDVTTQQVAASPSRRSLTRDTRVTSETIAEEATYETALRTLAAEVPGWGREYSAALTVKSLYDLIPLDELLAKAQASAPHHSYIYQPGRIELRLRVVQTPQNGGRGGNTLLYDRVFLRPLQNRVNVSSVSSWNVVSSASPEEGARGTSGLSPRSSLSTGISVEGHNSLPRDDGGMQRRRPLHVEWYSASSDSHPARFKGGTSASRMTGDVGASSFTIRSNESTSLARQMLLTDGMDAQTVLGGSVGLFASAAMETHGRSCGCAEEGEDTLSASFSSLEYGHTNPDDDFLRSPQTTLKGQEVIQSSASSSRSHQASGENGAQVIQEREWREKESIKSGVSGADRRASVGGREKTTRGWVHANSERCVQTEKKVYVDEVDESLPSVTLSFFFPSCTVTLRKDQLTSIFQWVQYNIFLYSDLVCGVTAEHTKRKASPKEQEAYIAAWRRRLLLKSGGLPVLRSFSRTPMSRCSSPGSPSCRRFVRLHETSSPSQCGSLRTGRGGTVCPTCTAASQNAATRAAGARRDACTIETFEAKYCVEDIMALRQVALRSLKEAGGRQRRRLEGGWGALAWEALHSGDPPLISLSEGEDASFACGHLGGEEEDSIAGLECVSGA
ncbi:amine-terminal region of a tm vesicle-mediated sorter, partial [Cystoisospora suis]